MLAPESSSVWLVSGANRGIGLAFVEHIAAKESQAIIYAGVRDLATSGELQALQTRYMQASIRILQLVSGDECNNKQAAAQIAEEAGRLDYVVANAGIGGELKPLSEISLDHFRDCFTVNTLGPIALFQATYNLLQKGTTRRFAVVTSRGGSITELLPMNFGAYGVSKSAANYFTQKLGQELESEGFVVMALSPGFVQSEMSLKTIRKIGMDNWTTVPNAGDRFRPITAVESVTGLVKIIKTTDRERAKSFLHFDGTATPW